MSTFSKEKNPTFYYFSEDNLYTTFFLASEIDITNQTTLRATLRQPCSLLKVVRVIVHLINSAAYHISELPPELLCIEVRQLCINLDHFYVCV
jgi:hypothetical protein